MDDLFGNHGGWIITIHEGRKTKLAACSEDSVDTDQTRDWIVVDSEQTRLDTLKPPKGLRRKMVLFFLSDLLRAKLIDEMFVFRNISFTDVLLCGVVIDLSTRGDYHYIKVDDGTSAIMCLIRQDLLVKEPETAATSSIQRDIPNDELARVELQMVNLNKQIIAKMPYFNALQHGDIVKITGCLSEYKGKRYVFIFKMNKEPEGTIAHLRHLANMIHLYKEVY